MRKVTVVGAGMVGLATAWHLQQYDLDVTVIDRKGIAAGSSWGNAGWLTPGLTMPLADPTLWTYAPRALLDPNAPLHIPFRFQPRTWAFLLSFASRGTMRAWNKTMAGLSPINRTALAAFDELTTGGVDSLTKPGPFVVGFRNERGSRPFVRELEHVAAHGQEVPFTRIENRTELMPHLSDRVEAVYRLDGQRFIEPGPFAQALGDAVAERGGTLRFGNAVAAVGSQSTPYVVLDDDERIDSDALVIATGAWLPNLAREFGVRTRVQAGRGYSFSVATREPIEHPVYFPLERVACTPYQGRLRIAGTMEFRGPDEPLQPGRIRAIANSAGPLFEGLDLEDRQDEWVGSRPVTPDGLPLVGQTTARGVYVAGGHGMWGVALGPATGKFLAEQIVTGKTAREIAPFDPLR